MIKCLMRTRYWSLSSHIHIHHSIPRQLGRNTEVSNLYNNPPPWALSEEDIATFDVSVDLSQGMQVRQPLESLPADEGNNVFPARWGKGGGVIKQPREGVS
jgi:hypothetical protein